jgi:hypothetical protein
VRWAKHAGAYQNPDVARSRHVLGDFARRLTMLELACVNCRTAFQCRSTLREQTRCLTP